MKALHGGRLPDVADVHGDLRPPPEGLGMEKEDNGRFKLAADGGVHLRTHHHHALKNRQTPASAPTEMTCSCFFEDEEEEEDRPLSVCVCVCP